MALIGPDKEEPDKRLLLEDDPTLRRKIGPDQIKVGPKIGPAAAPEPASVVSTGNDTDEPSTALPPGPGALGIDATGSAAFNRVLGDIGEGAARGIARTGLELADMVGQVLTMPTPEDVLMGMVGVDTEKAKERRALQEALKIGFTSVQGQIGDGENMTQLVSEGVARFVTALIPAHKVTQAAGVTAKIAGSVQTIAKNPKYATAVARLATTEINALIAENIAFSPYEARLSNFVQEFDVMKNPVTEYLAAGPEDSAAEARFKQNLEAIGIGLLAEPFFITVRALKARGVTELPGEGAPSTPPGRVRVEDFDEILGKDDRVVRALVGRTVDDLMDSIRGGDLDILEARAKFRTVLKEIDPNRRLFPDDVRGQLEERIMAPPKKRGLRTADPDVLAQDYRANTAAQHEARKVTGKKIINLGEKLLVDHAGPIKARLLKEGGDVGQEAVMRFELAAGAPAHADLVFKGLRGEIYGPLGARAAPGELITGIMAKNDKEALDQIIGLMRGHEIARTKPRASRKVKVGETIDPETGVAKPTIAQLDAEGFLARLWQLRQEVGPDRYKALVGRADRYFIAMREQLGELHDAGIITGDEFKTLNRFDYQPREYINQIDPTLSIEIGDRTVSVKSSGIEPLGQGGEAALETDSAFLLAQVIGRTQSRIAKNEATRTLAQVADVSDNGIVYKKRPGRHETPTVKLGYMENGEAKTIFLDADYAESWVTRGQVVAPWVAEATNVVSGAALVRLGATGINPEFALVNMPRDLAYIWLTTNEYSPILPFAMAQASRDLASVATDAVLRKGRYVQYIQEGGGMSFLTHGARMHTGPKLGTVWERTRNALGYVNETSEILTRLMVRERALRNGLTPETATWQARRYLDFSQGGSIAKFGDSFMPYLNASIQGMRGAIRAAKTNPGKFSGKLAQLSVAASGLWLHNQLNYPEIMAQISPEEKARFWIFPTGQTYVDERGNTRHLYSRIAVEHTIMPMKGMTDALMERAFLGTIPKEEVVAGWANALSIVGDPATTMPPVVRMYAQYLANHDFYTNDTIWKGADVTPEAEIKVFPSKPTTQMAVDVGGLTGLSPERLQRSMGAILPRNIYTTGINRAYTELRQGEQYRSLMDQTTQEMLRNSPFTRRVFGVTHPLAGTATGLTEKEQEANTQTLLQNQRTDSLATRAYNSGRFATRGPEWSEFMEYLKDGVPVLEHNRLINRYQRLQFTRRIATQVDDVDFGPAQNPDWWLRIGSMDPGARAEVAYEVWRMTPPEKRDKLNRFYAAMPSIRGEEFFFKLERLKQERGKDWP